jgi:hypothetical protein
MPSRARRLGNLPELPEDPTDKATLRIEARADHGRSIDVGMTVPGRDTVACVTVAAATALGIGGPIGTIYEAHIAGFPPIWTGRIACTQILGSVVLGLRAHRGDC